MHKAIREYFTVYIPYKKNLKMIFSFLKNTIYSFGLDQTNGTELNMAKLNFTVQESLFESARFFLFLWGKFTK